MAKSRIELVRRNGPLKGDFGNGTPDPSYAKY
jgi:hypothetical protein